MALTHKGRHKSSEIPRTSPVTMQILRESELQFSVDMYAQLQSQNRNGENIVFSPFSIAVALTMTLAGARNNTAEQLATLLRVRDHQEKIHDLYAKFLNKLSKFAPHVEFHVANRMYGDQQFPVRKSYRSYLENSYGATIRSVDFVKDSEAVRVEANAWVSEKTASKIQELLPAGSVCAGTALILLNAIYFKGFWRSPFEEAHTATRDFHLDSKNTVQVDTMFQESQSYKIGSSKDLRARALEMPYRGGKVSMVILLPDDVEGLPFLEKRISSERLRTLLGSLQENNSVQLSVPKFKLERSLVLNDVLKALGVVDLFTPEVADLSGIFEGGKPAVSDAVHKTFLQVDEDGTEAAAATGMVLQLLSAAINLRPTYFTVDHPFMFIIKTNEPDIILFVGSVRKP
ncbi:ipis-1-like [Dermacentor andersoni]|uniref:ipis-1-like n=1 Tax=Dermacentor andersoni TaxID=34620 RepID=UPI003B3AA262